MFKTLAVGLLAAQSVAAMRFAMYIDEYHVTALPGQNQTKGIDTAIMAFAPSKLFNSDSTPSFEPFESPETMRKRFSPDTKLTIAIGGWGDTSGFSEGAKDDASRERYAKNVAAMLDANGFDGVDIDWEYPGGNGQDYKDVPNSKKVDEIETYPKFLAAVRKAIGNKTLSIATPGRKQDFIAFTKEQGPKIFESVDYVNVMSYDLINRRDNVTDHHSGVQGSLDVINEYLAIGAPAEKLNLGLAFYAKWFTTDPDSDCDENPLGCKLVKLENDDGTDNGKSGALTFEASTVAEAPKDLKTTTNGKCGFAEATKCPEGQCCSTYGNCGTGDDFCQAGCLSDYGTCKGISIVDSWRKAEKDGKTDEKGGGQYYFDKENNIFWTWDTPEMIARKFKDIVAEKKLGGVMAWSLGEDTYKFAHLEAMQKGVESQK
ncbi:CAZyme family GH18 [Penicillium brevicompactum]|jgi:chitinase|uniref:chitinase n=1 Tax=Penicillium brevicompactum TaxID=5074 RepID=A0A9W9QKX2_PENBR|nr:CAZyme family GH18 [Penicillium brevicompactum]